MIRLENLSKAYAQKVLFQNISYHFPKGERIALVGANGAGKTTLLNIICDIEHSDEGKILYPSSFKIGYLPQEPNKYPAETILEECMDGSLELKDIRHKLENAIKEMDVNYSEALHKKYENLEHQFQNAGGYLLEVEAKKILLGLGFKHSQLTQHPNLLSGGWRMRLELARVFINEPNFLVLDEPTNHLDLPSLIWVENYLSDFEGTVLFVSHDKNLLNKLATMTLHLFGGKLTPYKGNFDSFLEQRDQKLALDAAAHNRLKKRMDEIQTFVDKFKAKASKAKQAQSRMKMLVKMKELEGSFENNSSLEEIAFTIPPPTQSGKEVIKVEKLSIGYSEPLSKNINFKVMRGQKIAVIGANGIGKSTLLKTISSKIPALDGRFETGYNVNEALFTQDQLEIFDEKKTILENMADHSPNVSEKRMRNLLGSFLFKGDDVYKPVGILSGGEKSRIGLASLLLKNSNFLLLDEPTNHLDLSSNEILTMALDEYEGTILFVSHDRDFINSICTHVFAMTQDGRSALFEGKLDDYEHLAAISGFPDILSFDKVQDNSASQKKETAQTPSQKSAPQKNTPQKKKK